MKRGRRQNEDGRINKQGEHECAGGIDGRELDRLPFTVRRLFEFACLDYRGMQVKIVRHYRCPQNANAHVKHPLISHDSRPWNVSLQDADEAWLYENQFGGKTSANR